MILCGHKGIRPAVSSEPQLHGNLLFAKVTRCTYSLSHTIKEDHKPVKLRENELLEKIRRVYSAELA